MCLSVCLEQLCFQWTDFDEIWRLNIFKKPVEKNSRFFKIRQE